jgi:hypothetical protein
MHEVQQTPGYARIVPMGIVDRLGNVIKSYLQGNEKWNNSGGVRRESPAEDPDLRAAFEELDEFLKGKPRKDGGGAEAGRKTAPQNTPPESLRPDFAELGLPFGAGKEECRAAYKRLLKLHHPDRHAGRQGAMEEATKKTARINAAYDRIETWQEGGTRL